MTESFIQYVLQDCRKYAAKYKCPMIEALEDWEGDGPGGSHGLNAGERDYIVQSSPTDFTGVNW